MENYLLNYIETEFYLKWIKILYLDKKNNK